MYITSTVGRRRRRLVALSETRASATNTDESIGSFTRSRVTHRSQTPPRISLHDAFSSPRTTHSSHLRQLKRAVFLRASTEIRNRKQNSQLKTPSSIFTHQFASRQDFRFQLARRHAFPDILWTIFKQEKSRTKSEETKSRPHLASKQELPHTRRSFPSLDIISNLWHKQPYWTDWRRSYTTVLFLNMLSPYRIPLCIHVGLRF